MLHFESCVCMHIMGTGPWVLVPTQIGGIGSPCSCLAGCCESLGSHQEQSIQITAEPSLHPSIFNSYRDQSVTRGCSLLRRGMICSFWLVAQNHQRRCYTLVTDDGAELQLAKATFQLCHRCSALQVGSDQALSRSTPSLFSTHTLPVREAMLVSIFQLYLISGRASAPLSGAHPDHGWSSQGAVLGPASLFDREKSMEKDVCCTTGPNKMKLLKN